MKQISTSALYSWREFYLIFRQKTNPSHLKNQGALQQKFYQLKANQDPRSDHDKSDMPWRSFPRDLELQQCNKEQLKPCETYKQSKTMVVGDVSPQFLLTYLPIPQQHHCFTNYINEHCLEELSGNDYETKDGASLSLLKPGQQEVSTGKLPDKPTALEVKPNEPQFLSNGEGKITSLPGLRCNSSTCNFSTRFSCLRTLTALAPVAQIAPVSFPAFEELASSFLSGTMEDHVLHSLSLLMRGKATGRDSINFLDLIGVPSFSDTSFPGCIRHPNIVPILGMMKSATHINIIVPKTTYTLENILHYSPDALKSNWHIKFLMYQLLSPLRYMHGLGIAHGSICPSNILLTDSFWCWLHIGDTLQSKSNLSGSNMCNTASSRKISCSFEGCHSGEVYADSKLSHPIDWHTGFIRWWSGDLSNFEYLLLLNRIAGRRWGDHTFHTVMPWVIDFSVKPDENNDTGWRNLSKSKWRLAKGDEQLDFTYSTSEVPHHVSDECLSELAVCSYKARRLPLSVLRSAVRSVYEPNEYPSTMHRLYQWTPDECIPEFYYDPQIFHSQHSGMSNLAVPSWADSPEEFIRLHREALESNRVSCQINHWIDIIFGYKMSGPAAISAKNVMLPPSERTNARSTGRRQLFNLPHPARWGVIKNARQDNAISAMSGEKQLLPDTSNLQALEEAAAFIEHASHLSPLYRNDLAKDNSCLQGALSHGEVESATFEYGRDSKLPSVIDVNFLLQTIEADDSSTSGYQDFLLWRQKASCSTNSSVDNANDVFSIGCILAELHLMKPLFNPTSLAEYSHSGVLPKLMHQLPPQVDILVEACIQKEWKRRPSIKSLLESPYFPATVRSSYLFLAPLQLLSKDGSRLHYVSSYANCGALKLMGSFAAEMCAPHCLPLLLTPLSDTEAESAYIMLKEFLKCLNLQAVKTLILPVIQKILQAGYSHMKVSLLQESFVRELWSKIGKQLYLDNMHSMVLSNLYVSPHKSSSGAASVLLIGSSDELGVPVTVHQTILPLIQFFGKGICSDGIDVIVRIGGLFGETFIVKQILPLLKNVVRSCIDVSNASRPEPVQSWSGLALVDCLMTLDGIVELLPNEVVVKELIEDGGCLYIQLLMIPNLGIPSLQVAATSLVALAQQIGSELTSLHVMPKLKELFEKLAFSEENRSGHGYGSLKVPKNTVEDEHMENRMDLVLLLYPPFAHLLGIETLRQCCTTWLILEKYLLWHHNWKWEYTEGSSRSGVDSINARRASYSKKSTSEYSANSLRHGVGWSAPQSQVDKGSKRSTQHKRPHQHNNSKQHEPWHWFPSPAPSWDGPDFLGRVGASSNEIPWKISASVLHSARGHYGALRSFAVCQDECTFFTAGVGPGFKGSVQKWDLSRIASSSGYDGHEEVVNDICVLASTERTASCDGTIHVWNSQSGKNISVITEHAENSRQYGSSLTSVSRIHSEQANMLDFSSLGSGILSSTYDGSLYTCMHHLETVNRLVAGTGNGSLRFIDIDQGQKLHLWRSDPVETSFPSLISSICSCGSTKMQANEGVASPSWIAAGLSSGHCRLLDMRSGNIITSWQAHEGYVTKLAAPEDHLLVSSSLDKTLRVWDLRKNSVSPLILFKGHSDGVSGFSVWGQDVISISRSKIGLSSLSQQSCFCDVFMYLMEPSCAQDGQHRITPQHLYMADRESRNMSVLSNITILPFSRLFLVGTEDGYLKVCC
ncbi:protein GFS12 isoform X1 [Tanacetum coccineum]